MQSTAAENKTETALEYLAKAAVFENKIAIRKLEVLAAEKGLKPPRVQLQEADPGDVTCSELSPTSDLSSDDGGPIDLAEANNDQSPQTPPPQQPPTTPKKSSKKSASKTPARASVAKKTPRRAASTPTPKKSSTKGKEQKTQSEKKEVGEEEEDVQVSWSSEDEEEVQRLVKQWENQSGGKASRTAGGRRRFSSRLQHQEYLATARRIVKERKQEQAQHPRKKKGKRSKEKLTLVDYSADSVGVSSA